MKIGVIGSGAVGSASLLALVLRGSARQIVVLNRDRKRARAVAMDIAYGASLAPVVEIRDILPRLSQVAPEALILVLTDPPDPLADLVRTAGFTRVLSSGTYLDSLRFRHHLARRLNLAPASVEANVLGEHGTSEVFMWSSARVGGVPVLDALPDTGPRRAEIQQAVEQDVRYANITIIE